MTDYERRQDTESQATRSRSQTSEGAEPSQRRASLRGQSYAAQKERLRPDTPVMRKEKPGGIGDALAVGAEAALAGAEAAIDALANYEDPDRVENQGNQFEDEKNAIEKLKDWVAGSKAYTNYQLLQIFYEATPKQRETVYFNTHGILYKLLATLKADQSLKVMNLCGFPLKWKVKHIYTDAKAGISRDLVMRAVHNAPLGERGALAKDKEQCELLEKKFSKDHPENLLGDGMRSTYYPNAVLKGAFWAIYPWYGKWADGTEKLDATARWAYIATAPADKITELKGKPAYGGRNQWTSLLHWGPRGAVLTAEQIKSVDTAALNGSVPLTDAFKAFEVRFNIPLSVPNVADITKLKFKTLYENLAILPPGTVNSDTIKDITVRQDPKALGSYNDYAGSATFGALMYDTKAHTSMADLGHTVRHEVGHQTDTKYGGFANLLSVAPGYVRKYKAISGWVDELALKMGNPGSAELKSLLTAFMKNQNTFANPHAAGPDGAKKTLWQQVSDNYNKNNLKPALQKLKAGGQHTASDAGVNDMLKLSRKQKYPANTPTFVGSRYFGAHYGEFFSWSQAIDDARGPGHGRSGYTMAAPYETYADLYAAYFSTKTARANNVPVWAGPHFEKVANYATRENQTSSVRPLSTAEGKVVG